MRGFIRAGQIDFVDLGMSGSLQIGKAISSGRDNWLVGVFPSSPWPPTTNCSQREHPAPNKTPDAVRNLVREGKTRQLRNVMTMSIGDGMQTLEMSLSELVRVGLVSYQDACLLAPRPDEVEAPPPPVLTQPGRR